MNLDPDHPGLAGHRVASPGKRRVELVEIGKVPADQDIAVPDDLRDQRRAVGIGEQVDRDLVEHRTIGRQRQAEADRAIIVREPRVALSGGVGQRDRHDRRQAVVLARPAARDAVVVGFQQDAGRLDHRAGDRGEVAPEILLLLEGNRLAIGPRVGKGEEHRGLHRLERSLEQRIVVLRRIEQYVDRYRLGAQLVDLGQRPGQHGAIDRRNLARRPRGVGGIDHQRHPLVGVGGRREIGGAQIVERAFGVTQQRQPPARPGDRQRNEQQQPGYHDPGRSELRQTAPRRVSEIGRPVA